MPVISRRVLSACFALALLAAACRPLAAPGATALPSAVPAPSPSAGPGVLPGGTAVAGTAVVVTVAPATGGTPTATRTPLAGSNLTVTLDDDGQTVRMHVGERFLLALGEGYEWTVEVADPTVLSRVVNVLVVRGAQGIYEAHRAGTTTLTATGDLPCRRAQPPCLVPSRLFRVTVVVQP